VKSKKELTQKLIDKICLDPYNKNKVIDFIFFAFILDAFLKDETKIDLSSELDFNYLNQLIDEFETKELKSVQKSARLTCNHWQRIQKEYGSFQKFIDACISKNRL
jgi:spermidine/putrescine-binding protein